MLSYNESCRVKEKGNGCIKLEANKEKKGERERDVEIFQEKEYIWKGYYIYLDYIYMTLGDIRVLSHDRLNSFPL